MELEAEVQKLREQNQELERKQVSFLQFSIHTARFASSLGFGALPLDEHLFLVILK
jgi:hypothetical protein